MPCGSSIASGSVSFRDIEKLLTNRGVTVSYEAVRQRCLKFGPPLAKKLRGRQGHLGDPCYLDELLVTIRGKQNDLWHAVDQEGEVVDILVQKCRDQRAAKRFFRMLLKGLHYVSRVIVTDQLGGDVAVRR